MSLHYLIDGYNLLYALPDIPTGPWDQKRQALLHKLAAEKPQGKNRVTVIFDSREGFGDRSRQGDMDIFYTAGETADDWIIKKVREVSNPRILVVVTNDQGLRKMIRGTGAKWMETAEFWKLGAKTEQILKRPTTDFDSITDEFKKKWL